MIEFLYDAGSGILYAYKDGLLVGPVTGMADPKEVPAKPTHDLWKEAHRNA